MVRFTAGMLVVALAAASIVACGGPHQPGPPPPPATPSAPRDSGSFTWQSGRIAAL